MKIAKEKVGRLGSEEKIKEKFLIMDNEGEFSPGSTEETVLPSVEQDLNTDNIKRNDSLFLKAPLKDDTDELTEKMKPPPLENIAEAAPSEAENLNIDGKLETKTPCTFVRGVCKKHNMKGEKVITKKRSWVMKKTGLAGWSTSRTVTYRCRLGIKAESAGIVVTNDVPMPDRSPAVEYSRTFEGISEHGD